jgi:4-hydroxybenzoate polyprenyltransferase
MLGIFRHITDFLIYSNIYIAAAAVLMTIQAQIQLGMAPDWHPYLFLIFFATLFEYNLHKFVAVFFYKHALDPVKFGWINRNLKLFYAIVFLSVAGFIVAALFARWSVLVTLFPLGLITFLYSFPVYTKGLKIFRLREVPLVKIFIISFVWSATCIILPVVQADLYVSFTKLSLLIAERFLFVFAITVPFDIRDMEGDQRAGLKTLPLLIGEKKSILTANIALLLFLIVCLVHYISQKQYHFAGAFLISGFSTMYFINNKKITGMRQYHYGVLDGTMSIQGILIILCFYIFGLTI